MKNVSVVSALDHNEDPVNFKSSLRSSPSSRHAAASLNADDPISQFTSHALSLPVSGKPSVSRASGHSSARPRDLLIKNKDPRLRHEEVSRVTSSEKSSVIGEGSSTMPVPPTAGPSRSRVLASTSKKDSTKPSKKESKTKKEVKDTRQYTPLEYARKLQEKLGGSKSNYLKDKHIFYTGGDWKNATEGTRKKMDYVCQIISHAMPF